MILLEGVLFSKFWVLGYSPDCIARTDGNVLQKWKYENDQILRFSFYFHRLILQMQSSRPRLQVRMDSLNTTLDSQQLVNQPIMHALPGTHQIRQKICHFAAEIGMMLNIRSRQELKSSFATIFFTLTEDEWATAQMGHAQKKAEELMVKQIRLVEENAKRESIDASISATSIQDQASSFQRGSLEEIPDDSRKQPTKATQFVNQVPKEAKGGNIEVTSLESMNPAIFVKVIEKRTNAPLKFNKVQCARRVSQRAIEMSRQATLQRTEERFDSTSFSPLKYGQISPEKHSIYASRS